MPNDLSASSSDPIAAKLLEADAELTKQEADLRSQLNIIQGKRQSLAAVLQMFTGNAAPAVVPDAALSLLTMTPGVTDVAPTPEPAPSSGRGRASKAVKAEAKTKGPKATKAESKGSRTAPATKPTSAVSTSWQSYVRKPFRHLSLPQAVLAVMKQHADDVVEVSYIMDQLFEDKIPKETRLEARDRLSNVLSVGLKNNKWYRGKTGEYSVSKEAAAASLER